MTPELWQRLKPLYDAALDTPAKDRARFVAEHCGNDDELREGLETLLAATDEAAGTLDVPLVNLGKLFPANDRILATGELLEGRFKIVRHIGSGGMGDVYEAHDLLLRDGRIALKTIRRNIANDPEILAQFKQEAQLARRVTGPNVCRIHELFVLAANEGRATTALLSMEYLEGTTLADRIADSGPFAWREAREIALDICAGMHEIHKAGIIHRDLKTRNIMLSSRYGKPCAVVMDFGLARTFSSPTSATVSDIGQERSVAGTPDYMAPEQFEGKNLSPATDIYALGIVLYELATGKHPFSAHSPLAAAARRARMPEPASSIQRGLPRHWDRIIERCLEYEPGQRFQSAEEVARALRTGPANPSNIRHDRPWILRAAAAVLLAALVWGGYRTWQWSQLDRPGTEAKRFYFDGLAALREGNYVKSTRSFQAAIDKHPEYVMAHARLAEAWSNLDFEGNAQQEMLLASAGQAHVRPLDRMYLEAIRETINHHFPQVPPLYRDILNRLPKAQKPAGYVELGMAYERAGDPQHALDNYTQAAKLDGDNVAAYMHTAVLETRLHHLPEADKAFNRAEGIFAREMNPEGQAELDYQRGYAASASRNWSHARQYLDLSMAEAKRIPSVQLEIRILVELSTVAFNSDQDEESIHLANRAIKLARTNQLDIWAASGLVCLANAELDQRDYVSMEDNLRDALQLARQSQQRRVEAEANLTLASLRNQQHLSDQVIAPAQAAFDYYNAYGFFIYGSTASVLLIRAERDSGHLQQALFASKRLLELVTKSGDPQLMMQAEELTGSVYLNLEQFPESLEYFEKAQAAATTNTDRQYESLNCADVLWRLGRYSESDIDLDSLPQTNAFTAEIAETRMGSLISRHKFREAMAVVRKLQVMNPAALSDPTLDVGRFRAIAEAHVGLRDDAIRHLHVLLSTSTQSSNASRGAELNLAAAEIYTTIGMLPQGLDNALLALSYFSGVGRNDSALSSASLATEIAIALGANEQAKQFKIKAVDILSQLQHTWEPSAYSTYLSRPDRLHMKV